MKKSTEMKLESIIAALEEFAPKSIAESWDNVGLMVGNSQAEVKSVLLTLDVTHSVVEQARERGIEMIISHHPLIFTPLKAVTQTANSTDAERAIYCAIENNIAIYSAHTNADSAHGGVSQILAEKIGVQISSTMTQESNSGPLVGLGAVGELPKPMETIQFLQHVKELLKLKQIRHSKPHTQQVQRVALCGGSGASLIERAKEMKADIYLTGDLKYHDYFAVNDGADGITIADIGHYESEIAILDKFEEVLRNAQSLKGLQIERTHNSGNPILVI